MPPKLLFRYLSVEQKIGKSLILFTKKMIFLKVVIDHNSCAQAQICSPADLEPARTRAVGVVRV